MTFIASTEVDEAVRQNGMCATLQAHGRKRVAPGFTVADYIKIGEFYANAHHPKRGDLKYWDNMARTSGDQKDHARR